VTTAAPAPGPVRTTWRILTTAPMSGEDNMAFDRKTLGELQQPQAAPVFRLFRWKRPTLSYGRHQDIATIRSKIPPGWDVVQRPTGGGIVLHRADLCFSLCWRLGQRPVPARLKDTYSWIHGVAALALSAESGVRLADCRDCSNAPVPFATRDCFTQPVAFDVLQNGQKVIGGALCRQKNVFLYQGSIQQIADPWLENRLKAAFFQAFQS
jgi:lipoate-protein ligase A